MDPHLPDSSNMKTAIPSLGGALQLTGGNPYFLNSTWIMYQPSQTFWTILVPIILGGLDAATSSTFSLLHLICVEIPQILILFCSVALELSVTAVILSGPY